MDEERVLFHGHPSWRSILDLYVKGWLATVVVAILVAAVTDIAAGHIELGWVVLAVSICLAAVFLAGFVRRKRTLYTITTQRLTIRTGLFARSVQETRVDRIQNVNSRQSVLERILGVGTIEFDTAAGAEYNFAFRGLAAPDAVVQTVDRALREVSRPGV
ncbi:MAG: PH domain-containing protein [Actinomycetota bacterium]|nr:PH domain-containing protein [Actinomycetota bacterium]